MQRSQRRRLFSLRESTIDIGLINDGDGKRGDYNSTCFHPLKDTVVLLIHWRKWASSFSSSSSSSSYSHSETVSFSFSFPFAFPFLPPPLESLVICVFLLTLNYFHSQHQQTANASSLMSQVSGMRWTWRWKRSEPLYNFMNNALRFESAWMHRRKVKCI